MTTTPDASPATPRAAAASRPLAGLELAMRFTEDFTPFNVVIVVRFDGELTLARLRAALDELQRRHRLLRARILPEGKGHAFHFDAARPIGLEVDGRREAHDWIAGAEAEFRRGFALTDGPLMRARLLAGVHGGDLILTLHHAIIDAGSAKHLMDELLALCAGESPAEHPAQTTEGHHAAPTLYPREYTGLGYARALAAFMRRQMVDEMKFRWGSRGVRTPAIADCGRCCLLPVRFSAELTTRVMEASRRQRVTVNAILGAAMLTAVQRRLYPSPVVPLRHIIFADLRARLRAPAPVAALGCLLTMFRFTVTVRRDGDFWNVARSVQDSTVRAARTGERYLAYSMSPGMMKMIFRTKAFRMGATALSYSGPLEVPESHGAFRVTGLHAFATNMTVGPEYTALVRLFRGELWWDIMYMDSDMDMTLARLIAADMETIVTDATC